MENDSNKSQSQAVQSMARTGDTILGSFARLKFITIACVVGMFLCAAFCVVYTVNGMSELGNKIYVLDKGQVMTASRQDVSITRRDEVIEQSTKFHRLFFNVSPNRDMVKRNVEASLEISDRSVYNYYMDLQEKGFYKRIAQTNASQEIVIDSVHVDMKRYPYGVVTYATLFITRESNITMTSLISRCSMLDVPRTAKNLNGLQIEKFEVVESKEIERRRRTN